jgi:hypothetical protein
MRSWIPLAASCLVACFIACSDDDGANIVPNGPPGVGGASGGAGGAGAGGRGGGPGGGGVGGTGGSPAGGAGGSAGCIPVGPSLDAGADAGLRDAGPLDAGGDGGDLDASASAGGVVSFAADVHPLFETKCTPCHVSLNSAGHNVGGELNQAYADAVRLGATIVERINGGGMPPPEAPPPNNCGAEGGGQPGDEGCLSVAEVALVQAWIDQCYPR